MTLPKLCGLLLLVPAVARADLFGVSDSKMIVQLTQMVNTLQAQLNTLQKTYDVGLELYDLAQRDVTSLDRVLNTELVALMREQGWLVEGIGSLQSLNAIQQQIAHLQRLAGEAKDAETREQIRYALELLKQQRTLVQLADQANQNIQRATTDISQRESARLTAENTAVLARAALAAQTARDQAAATRKAARGDEAAFAAGAARIYRNAGGALMDSMLGLLERFLDAFSPSYIYEGAYQIATSYLSVLSGVLLLIAVVIRLANSSLDALDGHGRYAALIKSLLIWGSVLALYFVLAGLVTELFNVLYGWSRSNGSIGRALSELGVVLHELNLRQAEARETMSTLDRLGDLAANIPRGIAFFLFFVSFVLLVSVQLLFQIAQAIGYTAALVFGTVAIPLAVSQTLSILRGWGVLTATVLAWPIVEALFMYLILGMSAQLGEDLTQVSATNASAAGIYLIFTVMNIVMTVTIISAPFVTMALISNSGQLTGLVTPFAGGAMATTAAVTKLVYAKTLAEPAAKGAAGVGGMTSAAGTAAVNRVRHLLGHRAAPAPVRETPASPPPNTPTAQKGGGGAATAAGGAETAPTQDGTAQRQPASRRSAAEQARRGAIIHQQTKPKR